MAGVTERVDKQKHPFADQLAEELEWQAARLKEARALIKNASVIISYDNGGGQTGIRKNPAYEAYTQLFGAFCKGMAALDEVLDGAEPESTAAKMTLDNLRLMVGDKMRVAK